jgi:hypothetical protein
VGGEIKSVKIAPGSSSVVTSTADEDGFLYARVTRREAPLPARFAARLPRSIEEFESDGAAFPPLGQVSAALCAGDRGMFDRWIAAIKAAAERGPIAEDLRERFVAMTRFCEREAFCIHATKALDAAAEPVRAVLYPSIVECSSQEARVAIESGSTDEAVIDWYMNAHGRRFEQPTPRFVQAAQATVQSQSGKALRTLGVTLGRFEDPQIVALVRSLGNGLDAESRAWLAIGLEDHPTLESKRLYAAACKHSAVGKDPMCRAPGAGTLAGRPVAAQTLAERVREPDFEPAEWLAAHADQRDALFAEFRRCVQVDAAPEWERAHCMRSFAALDRPSATAFAAQLPADAELPRELRTLRSTLATFRSTDSLDDALIAWGLMKSKPVVRASEDAPVASITAYDRLHDAECVHAFDVETGMFPNEHDVLMQRLAALARGDLAGVAFEEVPPRALEDDDSVEQIGPYLLRAYARGFVLETQAANNGDWYDLDAVLGLLNATARELRSDVRYVVAESDGQIASVLAAPKGGLAEAVKARVLQLGDASEAFELGKDYEQKVLDTLENEDPEE